jgi:hemerythrin-like domain-containing protein
MDTQPIKRHEALKNLSREHHDGLVFALRLQKGVAKKASLKDMEDYSFRFWNQHLIPHFEMEEQHLFPKFDEKHPLIQRAKQQHKDLKTLFELPSKSYDDFKSIYELLQNHIRLEERKLFNLLQEQLDSQQLKEFHRQHDAQQSCEIWPNPFWK